MSVSVTKIVNLSQAALKFLVEDEVEEEPVREYKTIGGVFSDSDYAWLSNGPRLEILHTQSGNKVGAWSFGWVLRDLNTEVVCVDEIQRPNGRLPLLAVGLDCGFSEGMICIFDFVTSKIIRAIHIKDKITTLHVIDAGYDVFTLPGPLRNFDGIVAVGTAGGDVFLVDICRQICDEALTAGGLNEIRDELNPCLLSNITLHDVDRIEYLKEFAVRNNQHLAIHLNIVFDKSTKHFILKGPKGDDRIHVNKEEVIVSALYYCPQLGSLLVGYNFGALQLYNLMNLALIYTSPVCDEHIPISHFAVQEPADDPRPVCYVWAVYSAEEYSTCLPLAVMYAFSYQTKEYHEGYGCLYQDFGSASVHYQMELGAPFAHKKKKRGGSCLKVKSIVKGSVNREGLHHDSNEDNLTLCMFVWNVWSSRKESDTFLAIFDLNQWYKEQMPSVPKAEYSTTYMLQIYLNELTNSATNKSSPTLDVCVDENSIQQFTGAQRLEEHFYPNSITFGMTCLRESDIIFLHNYGVQKALLAQIESSGPLCLVEPAEIYQGVVGLGLVPLFIDLPVNMPVSTNQQREVILGAALENHLMGWLCKCASEWANGSFLSTGCSLDLLFNWAFHRAVTLKTNCDKFCTSLFDYSEVRLDNNTSILVNSCTRQLRNLHSLYAFVANKLSDYISNRALVAQRYKSLETVSVYFEVLQWLLNVGLLPECPLTAYPRSDDLERINAPYPAEMLIDFYNHRRALLKILNEENFSSSESALFIDSLIERECGGKILQEQWRKDGGNGLYPPPSLQALLRTYLVDDVDLSYKHSVIIYVFLDLAMTLNQDKYKPIITHLIKFPAVFKVSPSVIKLTQAFWQLDHSDFNTAMGLLLDPLISSEDLNPWHHKIVLRALMLQKQHNFALLYVQVRKPLFQDDDDILTAISLYVANDMLDEAFYFEKYFAYDNQGNKFLTHLLNECKKNNRLKSLIHRSMAPPDEHFFLKYLTNSKESSSEDLNIYYHILRSHFIEAFESHERIVPNQIENKGLLGQENAIPRDKLVYSLKKLMPDVNRNLLNFCHKEKNSVWMQVTRPTPMSVFVHNLNENVQSKTTIIGAALAKAKQTFNETVDQRFRMETEGTPFLRTPTMKASSRRSSAAVVKPKLIDTDFDLDCTPPSAKRLKLSPRLNSSLSVSTPSKLDTPLVRRKTPKARDGTEERIVPTPQSILKVKSLINHTPKKDGEFEDDFKEFEKVEYTPIKKSGISLTPRKSLVRFEGLKSSSSSSLNITRTSLDKSTESSLNISSEKSAFINSNVNATSSKNTSTEDEVFYSPDNSIEEKQKEVEKGEKRKGIQEVNKVDKVVEEAIKQSGRFNEDGRSDEVEKSFDVKSNEEVKKDQTFEEKVKSSPVFSPKGRRSYRRSLELTPIRSSPRLSRNASMANMSPVSSPKKEVQNEEISSADISTKEDKTEESVDESSKSSLSPVLPKLRPRKSLCRKVLETNTLHRALNSPLDSPKRRSSRKLESSNITETEESSEKVVLESTMKYEDGEEISKASLTKKHSFSMSAMESDVESSDFSFDESSPAKPELSVSMWESINNIATNSSFLEESVTEEISSRKDDEEISVKIADHEEILSNNEEASKTLAEKIDVTIQDKSEIQEADLTQNEVADITLKNTNESEVQKIAYDETSTFDQNKTTYSDFESSTEFFSLSYEPSGLKLSDSMRRCLDDLDFTQQETDKTQAQNEESEVMEVDDDIEMTEVCEDKDKSDELIYVTLTNTDLDGERREEADELDEEEKEEVDVYKIDTEAESIEFQSTSQVDPEMNVFEISDDLSFNDGLLIEKEVTFEEDLSYDQQIILEDVLEETVGVSTLKVLEKNVFEQGSSSEEEANVEDEDQAEPLLDESNDESERPQSQNPEEEIIEIGSSSEDEARSDESNASNSPNSSGEYVQENQRNGENGVHVRNIYESDDDSSSESYHERNDDYRSELSSSPSEDEYHNSREGFGLFQGDIVFNGDENGRSDETEESRSSEEVAEREVQSNNEEDRMAEENVGGRGEDEEEEVMSEESEDKDKMDNKMDDESVEEKREDDDNAEDKNETENKVNVENVEERNEENEGKAEESKDKIEMENKVDNDLEEKGSSAEKVEESKEERDIDQEKEIDHGIEASTLQEEGQSESKSEDRKEENFVEMDDLNYSLSEESEKKESSPQNKVRRGSEENGRVARNKSERKSQDEVNLPVKENPEENVSEEKIEETVIEDFCDVTLKPSLPVNRSTPEPDILEKLEGQEKIRTRSKSVSSSTSKKSSGRAKKVTEEVPKPKRVTRGSIDVLENLEASTSQCELDVLQEILKTPQVRTLRTRRVSTEENTTPTVTLRKRSASVSEIKSAPQKDEQGTKNEEVKVRKLRGRRAASVSNLPKIDEEDEVQKQSQSVLEGYSMNRRVTRQQVSLLKKVEDAKRDLKIMDAIVVLDRTLVDDKPDPEERNIYDSSPSTTSSTASSNVRASRRLRSASETSNKSVTPVKSIKRSPRKKSTDESSSQSVKSVKKKLEDVIEADQNLTTPEPRNTRSRAKSVSSVNSEDSNVSEPASRGKRKQRVALQSTLPEIQEETEKVEKSAVPKKRTRKNSSQK